MQQPRRPSFVDWWDRNWKWVVPVLGCGVLAFAGSIVLLVFALIKSSGAYRVALDEVQRSPEVIAVLGEPVTPGWYVMGNLQTSGSSGTADLAYPVSGPRGSGTVIVEARKRRGQWQCHYLAVDIEGSGESLVLIDSAPQSRRPAPLPGTDAIISSRTGPADVRGWPVLFAAGLSSA